MADKLRQAQNLIIQGDDLVICSWKSTARRALADELHLVIVIGCIGGCCLLLLDCGPLLDFLPFSFERAICSILRLKDQ